MHNMTLTTSEVAGLAGVHRDTLLRWLREKAIPEPSRDHRGWRVFNSTEALAISRYAETGSWEQPISPNGPDHDIAKLHNINWNFESAKTRYLTHGMHPYPAKFIPQIPNALIQELSSVGETVADIFCGSGTTLLEALQLKRNAIGIDANPLACLVSGAKTKALSDIELEEVGEHLELCKRLLSSLQADTGDMFFSGKIFQSEGWRPDAKVTDFWFFSEVVEELAEILLQIRKIKSKNARNLCLSAFSAIIVTVSKQDSDTRYVRREKQVSVGSTLSRYISQLASAMGAVLELGDLIEDRFNCEIIHSNILEAPKTGEFDLVVSSPPYPNAYSYHLYHRLRLLWLGFDDQVFKKAEIGSHRKYSSKGKNKATSETFANEFSRILMWLKPKLAQGRYACLVVGDSTLDGNKVDNAQLISEVAKPLGFVDVDRIERQIAPTRKAFNPKIGKIKSEKILILRNGG
ncbi:MAG: helix-turn-helix domain-containing protein [Tateyamaria sp.]|uniref:DNA methyltransferase n=1 Tax=Tateyamaria sp. TaxID=1929288 RepID=UPI00329CDDC4